jgi:hypothetical protein
MTDDRAERRQRLQSFTHGVLSNVHSSYFAAVSGAPGYNSLREALAERTTLAMQLQESTGEAGSGDVHRAYWDSVTHPFRATFARAVRGNSLLAMFPNPPDQDDVNRWVDVAADVVGRAIEFRHGLVGLGAYESQQISRYLLEDFVRRVHDRRTSYGVDSPERGNYAAILDEMLHKPLPPNQHAIRAYGELQALTRRNDLHVNAYTSAWRKHLAALVRERDSGDPSGIAPVEEFAHLLKHGTTGARVRSVEDAQGLSTTGIAEIELRFRRDAGLQLDEMEQFDLVLAGEATEPEL